MELWKTILPYATEYENPIKLSKGEVVKLGNPAPEEKWKDWIWAENDKRQGGWVPIQIIENLDNSQQALVLDDYSAKELNVTKNEIVVKVKSLNGWSWVRKITNKEEGWIPDEVIERCVNE